MDDFEPLPDSEHNFSVSSLPEQGHSLHMKSCNVGTVFNRPVSKNLGKVFKLWGNLRQNPSGSRLRSTHLAKHSELPGVATVRHKR